MSYTPRFCLTFAVYPELRTDPRLPFEFIDVYYFSEFYKYLKLFNIKFSPEYTADEINSLREIQKISFQNFQLLNIKVAPVYTANEIKWLREIRRFRLNDTFASVNTSDPNIFTKFDALVKDARPFSPEIEQQLLIALLENFKIDNVKYDIGRIGASKNLHFLLSEGVRLQDLEQWYRYLPWEDLRDHQIYIFEHMENEGKEAREKTEILNFLNEKYPNLVRHHLSLGNFFIAEQLIEYGLKEPDIDLAPFLVESIQAGLKGSKEIKKFHALLLLLDHLGLLSNNEINLLSTLIGSEHNEAIRKVVLSNLPGLVEYYLKNHVGTVVPKKENYKRLCSIMLAIETDYAIALSTLYNLPIINSQKPTRLSRGITVPDTALNNKMVQQSWFNYGFRAGYVSFFGHGYNHSVHEGLEEGPKMAWVGSSDTTRVSPILSTNYAHSFEKFMGYLVTLRYQAGQPVFTGNIGLYPGKMPTELELAFCCPDNIEAVYTIKYGEVVKIIYKDESNLESAALLVGENSETERSTKVAKIFQGQFLENLQPYAPQFTMTFEDYVKQYNVPGLQKAFAQNYQTFSTMPRVMTKEMLQEIGNFLTGLCERQFPGRAADAICEYVRPSPMLTFSAPTLALTDLSNREKRVTASYSNSNTRITQAV